MIFGIYKTPIYFMPSGDVDVAPVDNVDIDQLKTSLTDKFFDNDKTKIEGFLDELKTKIDAADAAAVAADPGGAAAAAAVGSAGGTDLVPDEEEIGKIKKFASVFKSYLEEDDKIKNKIHKLLVVQDELKKIDDTSFTNTTTKDELKKILQNELKLLIKKNEYSIKSETIDFTDDNKIKDATKLYVKHLQIAESSANKGVTFKKVSVTGAGDANGNKKFGIAKFTDFNYFDASIGNESRRIIHESGQESDKKLEDYKEQLAIKLAIYEKLKEKVAPDFQDDQKKSIEIKESDSSIKDIDIKICNLIDKIPDKSNITPELSAIARTISKKHAARNNDSPGDSVGVAAAAAPAAAPAAPAAAPAAPAEPEDDYKKLSFQLAQALNDNNVKTALGLDDINKKDIASQYEKANKLMQNEALKGNDAEFFRVSFDGEYNKNSLGLKKVSESKEKTAQDFRVEFKRQINKVESKVSVAVSGKFSDQLDVINVCIDKKNNIYRQFKLKNGDNGKIEIASTNYAIMVDGKFQKIDIAKSGCLNSETYKYDNKNLGKSQGLALKKVMKHEEIKLDLNGEKYIFRAKNGIDIVDNTQDGFKKFQEDMQFKLDKKTFEVKPEENQQYFQNMATNKEKINIQKQARVFGKAKSEEIYEKYKIGTLKNGEDKNDIFLIKNAKQEYKLYKETIKEDGSKIYEEYKFKSKDDLKLGLVDHASPRFYGSKNLFGSSSHSYSELDEEKKIAVLDSQPTRFFPSMPNRDMSRVAKTEFEFTLANQDGQITKVNIEFSRNGDCNIKSSAPRNLVKPSSSVSNASALASTRTGVLVGSA